MRSRRGLPVGALRHELARVPPGLRASGSPRAHWISIRSAFETSTPKVGQAGEPVTTAH